MNIANLYVVASMVTLAAFTASAQQHEGYGLVEALVAGASSADDVWPFRYDANNVGGRTIGGSATAAIVLGAGCWAPEAVYQRESYSGTQTITVSGLTPGATYITELHNSENYYNSANVRVFSYFVNGVAVLTDWDLFARNGGQFCASCTVATTTANSDGKIIFTMTTKSDNSRYGGFAVFGATAPSAFTSFTATLASNGADLAVAWAGAKDVHRYYLQRSASATGPWTTMGTYYPSATGATFSGVVAPPMSFRVVASNGVGTVASDVVTFLPPTAGSTTIATTGSVVPNDAAAEVAISSTSESTDLDTLAADSTTVKSLLLNVASDCTLALAEGQALNVTTLGILSGGGNFTVGNTAGQGTVAGGPLNLYVADAGQTLTLKSSVTGAVSVVKSGAGAAILASGATYTGVTAVAAGTLTRVNDGAVTYSGLVSGAGTFVKDGAGVATLSVANPNFTGDFIINAGTLRFDAATPFKDATGTLTVRDGATLDVGSPTLSDQAMNIGSARKIIVSGSGVDGKGAIINSSSKSQYNALVSCQLAGDTVFGGTNTNARWDFRNTYTPATFEMNGHTIDKVGSNMVCLTGITLTEGGTAKINVREGTWSSEVATTYSGGSANTLDVYSGAIFDLYSLYSPFTWTLKLRDGATYNTRNGSSDQNVLVGPVILENGTAKASINYPSTIKGVISGDGSLTKTGGGRLTFRNGANTYGGNTTVSGGELYLGTPTDLPSFAVTKLSATSSTVVLPISSTNWTESAVKQLADGATLGTGSALGVENAADVTLENDYTFSDAGFAKYGAGLLTIGRELSGTNGALTVYEGQLTMAKPLTHGFASAAVRGNSTLLLDGGTKLITSAANGKNIAIGTVSGQTAKLIMSNAVLVTATDIPYNTASSEIQVGLESSARGVFVLESGAVTNKMRIGLNANSQGAFIQRGGHVQNRGGAANDIRIGQTGYGYYELDGGDIEFMGYSTVGCDNQSVGVMVQNGGYAYFSGTYDGRFGLSRGGTGVVYQAGGTFYHNSHLQIGESDNTKNGYSCWTVDGATATNDVRDQIYLNYRTNHVAILNMNNGGTVAAKFIHSHVLGTSNVGTSKAYVNFDGGTFFVKQAGSAFNGTVAGNVNLPDRVTVYKGGATFECTNAVSIYAPLMKPEGKGVTAINYTGSGFIGAPHVTITGGGGAGASAIAKFDSRTGNVTGITITSPGFGYTSTPTVTLSGGGNTTPISVSSVTIGDSATTGGLTKNGSGTLGLMVSNTFGGPVTVNNGSLILNVVGAIPGGNDINLVNGTIAAASVCVTAGVVTAQSGAINGADIICGSFKKTGGGTLTLSGTKIASSGTVALSGGTLSVGDSSNAGLKMGIIANCNSMDTMTPNPATSQPLDFTYVNTARNEPFNITVVYTGFVWNKSDANVTWTFAENYDDAVLLKIDGVTVLNDASWNTPTVGNVTLTPGPHAFEVRFYQGGGGAGPNSTWANSTMAFAVDYQGRGVSTYTNFQVPVDPGDGSLFTVTSTAGSAAKAFAETTALELSNDAVLAYSSTATQTFASLTGGGTISGASVAVTDRFTMNASDLALGNQLTVTGGTLDVTGCTLAFNDLDLLPKNGIPHVVAEADGGIVGLPASISGIPDNSAWRVYISGNKLCVAYMSGTTLILK